MFDSVFGRSFNASKCKTLLRLAISRIKLLRNKRDLQLKQMKKELAQLLQTNQEPSARIRVEHIFREQNIMAAYEVIELFCELIIVRLPIIESQRQCPIDLREAIASLIFAAPRCSDVPELLQVRNLFSTKYGKEFVLSAAELRPDCGVNRVVIEKLSVRAPSGEVKLKLMKDIAEEHNVDWDHSATESELLKAPEDLLEGPTRFLGASQMALDMPSEEANVEGSVKKQNENIDLGEPEGAAVKPVRGATDEKQFIPFVRPIVGHSEAQSKVQSTSESINLHEQDDGHANDSHLASLHKDGSLGSDYGEEDTLVSTNRAKSFKNVIAAAQAAAESAERAAAAARAAASLASKKFDAASSESSSDSGDEVAEVADDATSDLETRYPHKPQNSDFDPSKHWSAELNSSKNWSTSGKPLFDEAENGDNFGSASGFLTHSSFHRDSLDGDIKMGDQSRLSPVRKFGKFDDHDGSEGASFSSWNLDDRESFKHSGFESASSGTPQFDFDQSQPRESKPEENSRRMDEPSHVRTASVNSYVHPKLPDYDELSARFEALRSKR